MRDSTVAERPRGSITSKYSRGYFLMLLVVLMVFVVSLFSGQTLSLRYSRAIGELLDLNELFVDVETTNKYVYDYYLYLRANSSEAYYEESAKTQAAVDAMMERMKSGYLRDVVDLCCMVQTYLDQSGLLMRRLDAVVTDGHAAAEDAGLAVSYAQTQDVISYINQSFKEIYSARLVTTQRTQAEIQRSWRLLSVLQIGMLLVGVGICFGFYRKVVHGITLSVKKLTAFASGVARQPALQEHVQIDTGDELAVFADAFNEMIDTIHAQMDQIEADSRMREQLQRAEMENLRISAALQSSQLKLLQARINPHFLFNTLNMISQTARMEDAEETARLMEATADFLRYNLGKVTKAVTLADEIENTRNYVYIQRCRFGERIGFVFEVDESCAGREVPCMILQPLVENSVTHGVGSMLGGGVVTIRLFRQDASAWLEVRDNGVGISAQRLAELRDSFKRESEEGGHIGLKNVYLRLKLFFGEELQFQIDSRPGDTVVRIGLPRAGGTPA